MAVSQRTDRILTVLNASESRTQNFTREFVRRGWQVRELTCTSWTEAIVRLPELLRALNGSHFVLSGVAFPFQAPWLQIARLRGVKVIIDCPMDITVGPFPKAWHWKRILRYYFRRADGFLTLASRDYLIQKFDLDPRKVLFIESCPDVDRVLRAQKVMPRYKRQAGEMLVCYSGVAGWQRMDAFVPIFKALRRRIPNMRWLVISDLSRPMIANIRARAVDENIDDAVTFLPIIERYEDFIATVAQSDLWISHMGNDSLLGKHELRMELLEVGLLAKPVVSVRTPALEKNGFRDGHNIIFVDPDEPEASAAHIEHFLRSPGEAERLGRNLSQHIVENFALTDAIDRLLDTFLPRNHVG